MDDKQENSDRLSDEISGGMRPRCQPFDGVEIWSLTKPREREGLGGRVTSWIRKNKHLQVVDFQISQSSDNAYHCVTVVLFYKTISQPSAEQRHMPAVAQPSQADA